MIKFTTFKSPTPLKKQLNRSLVDIVEGLTDSKVLIEDAEVSAKQLSMQVAAQLEKNQGFLNKSSLYKDLYNKIAKEEN